MQTEQTCSWYSSGRITLFSKISPHSLMCPGRTQSLLYVWPKTQMLSCFAAGKQLQVFFCHLCRTAIYCVCYEAHNRHNSGTYLSVPPFSQTTLCFQIGKAFSKSSIFSGQKRKIKMERKRCVFNRKHISVDKAIVNESNAFEWSSSDFQNGLIWGHHKIQWNLAMTSK